MPIIDLREVRGVDDEDGVYCTKCLNKDTPGWGKNINPSDFIMEKDIEEDLEKLYICDGCKEPL